MIGALIGAGSSLLGGILGNRAEKKATARQNEYNKPINVRARAEEGGFNPLLWAGQGNIQTQASGGGALLGNSIANAGLAIADGLTSEKKLKIERERLEMDKTRLEKLIQNATIRPRVGGIYSGNRHTPKLSNRPSVGAGAAGNKPPIYMAKAPEALKSPTEAERLDLDKGGAVKDRSIYEMDVPVFGKIHTSRPMWGERVEGYAGDVVGAPFIVPQLLSDLFHNAKNEYFDANRQEWLPKGKFKLEPKGSKRATIRHPSGLSERRADKKETNEAFRFHEASLPNSL